MKTVKSHSLRDPQGQIFKIDNQIYRRVAAAFVPEFNEVRATGIIDELIANNKLILEKNTSTTLASMQPGDLLLEHPTLPFISYPYEWPFSALKKAALFHLDLQLDALNYNITLCDSSPYNIQYLGTHPIFIDHLSFRSYQPNQFWYGHRQFMQEFLNPLLFTAWCGIPYQNFYRGQLSGMPCHELYQLLPWRKKISPRSFLHLRLPTLLEKQTKPTTETSGLFSKEAFAKLLTKLFNWVEELNVSHQPSTWQSYTTTPFFSSEQIEFKQNVIAKFAATHRPHLLADLGCNHGRFAEIALNHGAHNVIGFDADHNALEEAFKHAQQKNLNFTPLYMDLNNPSPNQGFAEQERLGFSERGSFDALMALAVIHHLALGQNIPLLHLCEWLVSLAPVGLIEFVPKSDPMAQTMLQLKGDIFPDYTLENCVAILESMTKVVNVTLIPGTQRHLIEYVNFDRINSI